MRAIRQRCLVFLVVLATGLVSALPTRAQALLRRPGPTAIAKAEDKVRDLYKADLAKAVKPEEKSALAETLLKAASASRLDHASRLVLLTMARDLAVDARNAPLAIEIVRAIVNRFVPDGPVSPKEQLRLGNATWKKAEAVPLDKRLSLQVQAAEWYLRAERAVTGLDETLITKRLAEIEESGVPAKAVVSTPATTHWEKPTMSRDRQATADRQQGTGTRGKGIGVTPASVTSPQTLPASPLSVLTNSISMKLALIPAGEFVMGAPDAEEGAKPDERPQHRVRITRPFYLGVYPVTQAEYAQVMGINPSLCTADPMEPSAFTPPLSPMDHQLRVSYSGTRPTKSRDTRRYPVESVSWQEAVEFCQRLSALPGEKLAGRMYRLPTEAEWEYACRAGSRTRFFFGDDDTRLGDYAWFRGNYGGQPHEVGAKSPNAWGLYDMHGCAWQWCLDWYGADYYAASPMDTPHGPNFGTMRVRRGSPTGFTPNGLRSASRGSFVSDRRSYVTGFRVAMIPGGEQPSRASSRKR